MIVVDTSVWIDFLNHHISPESLRLRQALQSQEEIALIGLIYTEILLGLRSDTDAQRITQMLTICHWLPEAQASDYASAAQIYRNCRSQGITIRSTIDCLIAQQCIQQDVPLLAKDRDFELIAKVSSLKLVRASLHDEKSKKIKS